MKTLITLLVALTSLAAQAAPEHLAMKFINPKDAATKVLLGKLVVNLYNSEMAKPGSPLQLAMQKLMPDDGSTILNLDPTDITLTGGSGGHDSDGKEEYTAAYIIPVYYGFKSGTWPLVYLQVITSSDELKNETIFLEKLVDVQITDKK